MASSCLVSILLPSLVMVINSPNVVFNLDTFRLEPTFVAPPKKRDGDIRYADGTKWNPSGGEGIYAFFNNTWNKL